MPTWAKWTLGIFLLIIVVLVAFILIQQRKNALNDKVVEKQKITREIDSLEAKRDNKIDSAKAIPRDAVQKANEIIKKIPKNEYKKPTDTSRDVVVRRVREFLANEK